MTLGGLLAAGDSSSLQLCSLHIAHMSISSSLAIAKNKKVFKLDIYCFVCLIFYYTCIISHSVPCRVGDVKHHIVEIPAEKGPEPKDTTERCTENAIDISSQTGDIGFK